MSRRMALVFPRAKCGRSQQPRATYPNRRNSALPVPSYWAHAGTNWVVQPVRSLEFRGGGHWRPVAETWGVNLAGLWNWFLRFLGALGLGPGVWELRILVGILELGDECPDVGTRPMTTNKATNWTTCRVRCPLSQVGSWRRTTKVCW